MREMKNLFNIFLFGSALGVLQWSMAQVPRGFSYQIRNELDFLDRSGQGFLYNNTPFGRPGALLPNSRINNLTVLKLSYDRRGENFFDASFLFEGGGIVREDIVARRYYEFPEDTEDAFNNIFRAERLEDFGEFNINRVNKNYTYTKLLIEHFTVRHLWIFDEFSMGSRVKGNWGAYTFNRDFQGLIGQKQIRLRRGFGIHYGFLFSFPSVISFRTGGASAEADITYGVNVGMSLTNSYAHLNSSYSFIEQTKSFQSPGEGSRRKQVRSFYLRVRSRANYAPGDPNTSLWPVWVGASPRAIRYIDSQGKEIASFDVIPPFDDRYVAREPYGDSRLVIDIGDNEPSGSLVSVDDIVGASERGDLFRIPVELILGREDFYRSAFVYAFPLNGENFSLEQIRSIAVRLNVKYSYAFDVSFDLINWKQIPLEEIEDSKPWGKRDDLGPGGNFGGFLPERDEDTGTIALRSASFSVRLDEFKLIRERNLHSWSIDLSIPRIHLRLRYYGVLNQENFYHLRRGRFSLVHHFNTSYSAWEGKLKTEFDYFMISKDFSTGFETGFPLISSAEETRNSLVGDNDNRDQKEALAYLQDRQEEFIPGYFHRDYLNQDRIILNPHWRLYKNQSDHNGNGYIDLYENDNRPDYPVRRGSEGYRFYIQYAEKDIFSLRFQSVHLPLRHYTGRTFRNDQHYLVGEYTPEIFILRLRTGVILDEVADDLYFQYRDNRNEEIPPVAGIYREDRHININHGFFDASFAVHYTKQVAIAQSYPVPYVNIDTYARVELNAGERNNGVYLRTLDEGPYFEFVFLNDGRFEFPFYFQDIHKRSLYDFTLDLAYQFRYDTVRDLNFSFHSHWIKHLGFFDLTFGWGFLDMKAYPFYLNQRTWVTLLGLRMIWKGVEFRSAYRYGVDAGNSDIHHHQFSGVLRVHF